MGCGINLIFVGARLSTGPGDWRKTGDEPATTRSRGASLSCSCIFPSVCRGRPQNVRWASIQRQEERNAAVENKKLPHTKTRYPLASIIMQPRLESLDSPRRAAGAAAEGGPRKLSHAAAATARPRLPTAPGFLEFGHRSLAHITRCAGCSRCHTPIAARRRFLATENTHAFGVTLCHA